MRIARVSLLTSFLVTVMGEHDDRYAVAPHRGSRPHGVGCVCAGGLGGGFESLYSLVLQLVGRAAAPAGAEWDRSPVLVNDHDFRSDAIGVGISYGIYDPPHNRGAVCVGISHDTPLFAAHSIATWWRREGSCRWGSVPWKTEIRSQLCNAFGIYRYDRLLPYRGFQMESHRASSVLRDLQKLSTTSTQTGLVVTAYLGRKEYPSGLKPDPRLISSLRLKKQQHTTEMELHHCTESVKLILRGR